MKLIIESENVDEKYIFFVDNEKKSNFVLQNYNQLQSSRSDTQTWYIAISKCIHVKNNSLKIELLSIFVDIQKEIENERREEKKNYKKNQVDLNSYSIERKR